MREPPELSVLVTAAVSRVLGLDHGVLRADSPLLDLGMDSLARVLVADAVCDGDGSIVVDDSALLRALTPEDLLRAFAAGGEQPR